MRIYNLALANHNILGRTVKPPSISVAPRLDYHTIIALIKYAILYKHIARHFNINAIVVVAVGINIKPSHGYIFTVVEVNCPKRRVADFKVFKPDIGTTVDL